MANTSYTQNANKVLEDDLKVFIGKWSEIKEIEDAGRVVNRKWYLSWDTGEIFVGNGVKKLIRYGGSANNLSKDDIKTLIDNYTKSDLNIIRAQMSDALYKYGATQSDIAALRTSFNQTVANLNNNVFEYIKQKVTEILLTTSGITYSKDTIDEKINFVKTDLTTNYINKNFLSTELSDYATKEYIDNNAIKYLSGNELLVKVPTGIYGAYMALSSSTDNDITYVKGHTYFCSNGAHQDITPEGTGSGTYAAPTIKLFINGAEKSSILFGNNFTATNVPVTFQINNISDMTGTLILYENTVQIKSGIALTNNSFTITTALTGLQPGNYYYTLVGSDKKGNQIIGTYTLTVIAPVYYGSTALSEVSQNAIKAFSQKIDGTPYGSYSFAFSTNSYIWICVPSTMTLNVKNITVNGFTVPFNNPTYVTMTFGTLTDVYSCYRNTNMLVPGEVTVKITE